MSEPNIDGAKAVPYDFGPENVRVPKGVRVFCIAGSPVTVPGPVGKTRIFVHPDDVSRVRQVNAKSTK